MQEQGGLALSSTQRSHSHAEACRQIGTNLQQRKVSASKRRRHMSLLDVMTRVAPDAASKISMPLVMAFSETVTRVLQARKKRASGLLHGSRAARPGARTAGQRVT